MSRNETKYIHPREIKLSVSKAEAEYKIALQALNITEEAIERAISMIQTDKDIALINKMIAKQQKNIISVDEKEQYLVKLMHQSKVSESMHQTDQEVFSHLESVEADSMIAGYNKTRESYKEIVAKEIALDKIDSALDEALQIKQNSAKSIAKKTVKINKKMVVLNMTHEQKLAYDRKNSVATMKKAFGGLGVIGAVGSFFFPPMLMITAPIAITGLVGYGTVRYGTKNKHIKKLVNGAKQDTKLAVQLLQDFAYPQAPQLNMGHSQPSHGQQQPYHEQDIYGDIR